MLAVALLIIVSTLPGPRAVASPTTSATEAATLTVAPTPTGAASAAPTSAAATSAPAAAVILAAGDISSCSTDGDAATADLLDDLAGTVVTLGDAVYPDGTAGQFADCFDPTWGRQRSRIRPTVGNHEYHTKGAAAYFRYFGTAAGDPATGYYAYDLGTWRVYSLNSNCTQIGGCDAGSAQVKWLLADLAANPRDCVLAYWHHPRYSSAEHGSQASVDGLWDTLYGAGAEVVLSGHDHDYERFAPQSDGGRVDPDRGIVEFVVGTGGFSHYPFRDILSTSRVRNNTTFGVLELTLGVGSWSSRFVPVAGKSFTDTAGGTCH